MQYLVSFLEGIITFISPCILPMLPIYISYFAAGESDGKSAVKGAVGFVAGFTTVFSILGALSGIIGGLLVKYQAVINVLLGMVVIFFGLNYIGIFNINIFRGGIKARSSKNKGFFSSFVLGTVFAAGWSPCVGIFLSSALILASQQATALKGILLLLSFSMGLGIPFMISAVLLDQLKGAFNLIKKNYKTVNLISGIILIITGILMATGSLNRIIGLLS